MPIVLRQAMPVWFNTQFFILFLITFISFNTLPILGQLLYELPDWCASMKDCPCEHVHEFDEIKIVACSDPNERNGRDTDMFKSKKPSNETLIYIDPYASIIPRGTFGQLQIARVEFQDALRLDRIKNDAFTGARIDSIKIDMTNLAAARKVDIQNHAFREWQPLNPAMPCKIANHTDYPWYMLFSKHCHGLELIKWSPLSGVGHVKISNRLLWPLSRQSRLVIEGDFYFSGGNEDFSSYHHLKHLQLGGYILKHLNRYSLGRLSELRTIRLKKFYTEFNIPPVNIRQWLSNKEHLERIALEDGLFLQDDVFSEILSPGKVLELSLRGAQFSDLPSSLHRLQNLQRLDLRDTYFTEPPRFLEPFQNLTIVWLDACSERECNCSTYDWIQTWGPFQKHGAALFRETINGSHGMLALRSDKVINLQECLLKCRASISDTQTLWSVCLLAMAIFYFNIPST